VSWCCNPGPDAEDFQPSERLIEFSLIHARGLLAILVSGGAGYIGSHAAHALRRSGYEVVLYDNLSTGFRRLAQGFELVEGDISDRAKLRTVLARVDAVMHFAAHADVGESVEHPRKYFHNIVEAALSLLNSVLDAGIRRIVFSSSCAVYGVPGKLPITEQMPREPVNPYGASKLLFENALEAYGRAYELRSVSLRYFNAAGGDESGQIGELHEPETHLIPLAIAASTGHGPELQIYGSDYPTADGTCVRDYVIHAAENATGRPVRRQLGPRRPGDPPVLLADPTRAKPCSDGPQSAISRTSSQARGCGCGKTAHRQVA